jgi:hypothetical protein
MICFHLRLGNGSGALSGSWRALRWLASLMMSMALINCDRLPDALNENASKKAGLNRRNVA